MFDKEKWLNMDLLEYRDLKIEEKISDNSIIAPIDPFGFEFEKVSNKLGGIPFALKDNFATINQVTTASTHLLENFKPSFTATVLYKLIINGAVPLFKANLDQLAMGGTGLTSDIGGPVYNPFHNEFIAGGSSSGSNYLVADGTVPFSIGSDTGDSVRKPASYTGVVGFKPTWGLVSRYGMYDFAPTWDTVAWFTNTVKEAACLLDVLQGFDPKDFSSEHPEDENYEAEIALNDKYKIVTMKCLEEEIIDEAVKTDYLKAIEKLREDGHEIVEADNVDKKILSTISTVYRIISSTEALSCNSNLTGFVFGSKFENGKNYTEKITNSRTEGFNYEVKKRFLWAQHARFSEEDYYNKAIRLRRLINNEINRILSLGDVLLIPSTPNLADDINAFNKFSHDNLLNNVLTIFNSNGSPSITVPVTRNGHLSTSVNVSALPFKDKKVLKLANRLEELL